MIKDIIEGFIQEIQNEQNQVQLYSAFEPLTSKIKISYYIMLFMVIIAKGNIIYSNYLLNEFSKKYL